MKIALAAAVLMTLAGAAHATELLTNGDFETGDLSGWTQIGGSSWESVENGDQYTAHTGNYYLNAGPSSVEYIAQTFADVVGQTLTVSGWIISDGRTPNGASISFDGTSLASLTDIGVGAWTPYTFTVLATGSDTLQIGFVDPPAGLGFDDFSVTTADVPEPAALSLLALGLLGVVYQRRARG